MKNKMIIDGMISISPVIIRIIYILLSIHVEEQNKFEGNETNLKSICGK